MQPNESMAQRSRQRAALGKLVLLILGVAFVLIFLRHLLWDIVTQVLTAAALAALLTPLCKWFERRLARPWAALSALIFALSALVLVLAAVLPPLIDQIQHLSVQLPGLVAYLQQTVQNLSSRLEQMGLPAVLDSSMLSRLSAYTGDALKEVAVRVGSLASGMARLGVAVVLIYYFLRDREILMHRAAMLIPLKNRRRVLWAVAEMRREVLSYLRGQVLVSVCVGSLTGIGLLIVGVPAWLALGLLMALMDLIPYFGPFLGAIPILLFSLSGGLTRVLWAMGVVLLAQQLEGSFVSPRVMGESTGLHPVVVVLALSSGGAAFGVWGMLLALPLVVAARGCLRVMRTYEERG